MKQLVLALAPRPEPTFNNFVSGHNQVALETLRTGDFACVLLWGEAHSGKTHLARAAVAALDGTYVDATQARALPTAIVPLLAIDNLDRLSASDQHALFMLLTDTARRPRRLLVTTRTAPATLPLREDLATRLKQGHTFHLQPLSDEEKRAALIAHAQARGFALPPEVASFLLTHTPRDMGSLMAALEALDRYSLEVRRPVSLPLLKRAIEGEPHRA